ncbi:hypothetical protein 2050HW_00213 [Serratia phage vB_SmaM_ 2050HW]|uniref:Uncharacterized protein n=1 Tax=Serratia phage vB_SmaM_ 2050HW TaxID=2024252 RepID=A0A289ZU09_9CAUD|nr:hypothetical protein HWB23_gp213 [Serratia phage vB_SmaM_ 2050HW]ATA65548.1 hypothetical protein 2050HW_00213 [Serratia phage vB_SmaM_ 2050HW]
MRKVWERRLEIIIVLVFVVCIPAAVVAALMFLLEMNGSLK